MKRNRGKTGTGKHVLLITGTTEEEAGARIGEHRTSADSEPRRCYVCKRQEGNKMVAFEAGHGPVLTKELLLHPITRSFGSSVHIYACCDDCILLLGLQDKCRSEDVVFIPVCTK